MIRGFVYNLQILKFWGGAGWFLESLPETREEEDANSAGEGGRDDAFFNCLASKLKKCENPSDWKILVKKKRKIIIINSHLNQLAFISLPSPGFPYKIRFFLSPLSLQISLVLNSDQVWSFPTKRMSSVLFYFSSPLPLFFLLKIILWLGDLFQLYKWNKFKCI